MSGVSFFDLLRTPRSAQNAHCDVCVIGAGAAGIYLAVQLASKGLDIILIEAGGSVCGDASEAGFDVTFSADPYPGATKGRAFGLGGATSRWGGVLVPHSKHDLREPADLGADAWSCIVRTASEKSNNVLKQLGYLEPGEFDGFAQKHLGGVCAALNASGFDVVASLSLPSRSKNLAFLLQKKLTGRSQIRVFVNTVAKSWSIKTEADSCATLQRLSAIASNGNTLHVNADRFVIAAGAIESARILLELNSGSSSPVLRTTARVGHYLADHLSVSIADVAVPSREDVARLFAPRFSRGWMRSFRFIEADPPPYSPRAFAHIIFENENPGFMLAKEVLGAMQGRRWPKVTGSQVVSGISGVLALARARYFDSTLYIPRGTKAHLQLDVEQAPRLENRVSLCSDRDRYGRQVAQIHWRISDIDLSNIQASALRILEKWPDTKKGLPGLILRINGCGYEKPHDAYHPVGTCRMGSDPEAVVDENLKVWGIDNLWVVSTGVLPNAGTANTTFTMLCLAEALAENLSKSSLASVHG
jgi:choline dehydrogenase-like flavoprotein